MLYLQSRRHLPMASSLFPQPNNSKHITILARQPKLLQQLVTVIHHSSPFLFCFQRNVSSSAIMLAGFGVGREASLATMGDRVSRLQQLAKRLRDEPVTTLPSQTQITDTRKRKERRLEYTEDDFCLPEQLLRRLRPGRSLSTRLAYLEQLNLFLAAQIATPEELRSQIHFKEIYTSLLPALLPLLKELNMQLTMTQNLHYGDTTNSNCNSISTNKNKNNSDHQSNATNFTQAVNVAWQIARTLEQITSYYKHGSIIQHDIQNRQLRDLCEDLLRYLTRLEPILSSYNTKNTNNENCDNTYNNDQWRQTLKLCLQCLKPTCNIVSNHGYANVSRVVRQHAHRLLALQHKTIDKDVFSESSGIINLLCDLDPSLNITNFDDIQKNHNNHEMQRMSNSKSSNTKNCTDIGSSSLIIPVLTQRLSVCSDHLRLCHQNNIADDIETESVVSLLEAVSRLCPDLLSSSIVSRDRHKALSTVTRDLFLRGMQQVCRGVSSTEVEGVTEMQKDVMEEKVSQLQRLLQASVSVGLTFSDPHLNHHLAKQHRRTRRQATFENKKVVETEVVEVEDKAFQWLQRAVSQLYPQLQRTYGNVSNSVGHSHYYIRLLRGAELMVCLSQLNIAAKHLTPALREVLWLDLCYVLHKLHQQQQKYQKQQKYSKYNSTKTRQRSMLSSEYLTPRERVEVCLKYLEAAYVLHLPLVSNVTHTENQEKDLDQVDNTEIFVTSLCDAIDAICQPPKPSQTAHTSQDNMSEGLRRGRHEEEWLFENHTSDRSSTANNQKLSETEEDPLLFFTQRLLTALSKINYSSNNASSDTNGNFRWIQMPRSTQRLLSQQILVEHGAGKASFGKIAQLFYLLSQLRLPYSDAETALTLVSPLVDQLLKLAQRPDTDTVSLHDTAVFYQALAKLGVQWSQLAPPLQQLLNQAVNQAPRDRILNMMMSTTSTFSDQSYSADRQEQSNRGRRDSTIVNNCINNDDINVNNRRSNIRINMDRNNEQNDWLVVSAVAAMQAQWSQLRSLDRHTLLRSIAIQLSINTGSNDNTDNSSSDRRTQEALLLSNCLKALIQLQCPWSALCSKTNTVGSNSTSSSSDVWLAQEQLQYYADHSHDNRNNSNGNNSLVGWNSAQLAQRAIVQLLLRQLLPNQDYNNNNNGANANSDQLQQQQQWRAMQIATTLVRLEAQWAQLPTALQHALISPYNSRNKSIYTHNESGETESVAGMAQAIALLAFDLSPLSTKQNYSSETNRPPKLKRALSFSHFFDDTNDSNEHDDKNYNGNGDLEDFESMSFVQLEDDELYQLCDALLQKLLSLTTDHHIATSTTTSSTTTKMINTTSPAVESVLLLSPANCVKVALFLHYLQSEQPTLWQRYYNSPINENNNKSYNNAACSNTNQLYHSDNTIKSSSYTPLHILATHCATVTRQQFVSQPSRTHAVFAQELQKLLPPHVRLVSEYSGLSLNNNSNDNGNSNYDSSRSNEKNGSNNTFFYSSLLPMDLAICDRHTGQVKAFIEIDGAHHYRGGGHNNSDTSNNTVNMNDNDDSSNDANSNSRTNANIRRLRRMDLLKERLYRRRYPDSVPIYRLNQVSLRGYGYSSDQYSINNKNNNHNSNSDNSTISNNHSYNSCGRGTDTLVYREAERLLKRLHQDGVVSLNKKAPSDQLMAGK